jgi:hypothetical protein
MEIVKGEIEKFTKSIEGFLKFTSAEQIDFFLYFLTVEKKLKGRATELRKCFLAAGVTPYSNISQFLQDNIKGKDKKLPRFIKTGETYELHRNNKDYIESKIIKNPFKVKANDDLRLLLTYLSNTEENEFLSEAINCFEIGAYRASIVMVWNLTINHLFEYILKHKLTEFDNVLKINTDKRVKITSISKKDDFNEIPENKFIEFCRSAGIISNDVRKKLDIKLGIRNTYAHPSNVVMREIIATEFIDDLVNNVVLKFSL